MQPARAIEQPYVSLVSMARAGELGRGVHPVRQNGQEGIVDTSSYAIDRYRLDSHAGASRSVNSLGWRSLIGYDIAFFAGAKSQGQCYC